MASETRPVGGQAAWEMLAGEWESEAGRWLRPIVQFWGLFFAGFVVLVVWLPSIATAAGLRILLWIATYVAYSLSTWILSEKAKAKPLYETELSQLFRIHFNLIMIGVLVRVAPPSAFSYLWFFFSMPLLAALAYFGPSLRATFIVFAEVCTTLLILTVAQGWPIMPEDLTAMLAKDAILGLLTALLYFFVHLSPRRREGNTLLEAATMLMQVLDQEQLAQLVADTAQEGIPVADAAVVHLVGGENKQTLVPAAASNLDLATLGRSPMELGKGIAGHAIQSREAKNVPDVSGGDYSHLFDPSSRGFKSLLAAPMYVSQKNVGTISVHSTRKNAFSQRDERFLRTLAAQGATAIANAGLYKKLADERNLLRTLIDNLPEYYVFAKDAEGRFVVGNMALARHMGAATPDDLIGKTDFDFYPQELAAQFYADEQALLQSGQSILDHEEATRGPDGNPRWTLTTKVLLHDSRGKVTGLVGVSRDITERKQAEEALAQERHLWQTFMDNVPYNIYFKDAEGHFTKINKSLASWFGLSDPSEAIGKADFEFFTDEHAQQAYDDEQKVMQTGQSLSIEEKETWLDGRMTWVVTTKMPLRDEEHNVVGTFGISRDVTERRQMQEALQQRNRELELLYQVSQTLASTLEIDHVLDPVLEAARGLLGAVAASLWLIDPATGELICQQAVTAQSKIVRGWRLAAGEGIVGWVVQHGKSQIVPDAQADGRHYKDVDRQTGMEVRSILCVPLRTRQCVIGALEVMDTRVGCFEATDLRLIEPLAATAAIAIANAQLYEKEKEVSIFNKTIVQSMDEGIILDDARACITFVNPRMVELLGYTPEELKGQHCTVIAMPEEKAKVEAEIARRALGVPNRYETVLRTKSGQRVPVIVSGTPLYDEQKKLTGSLCVYTDITDRKQQETRLQDYLSTVTSSLAYHTSLEGLYEFTVTAGASLLSARDCFLFLATEGNVLELVATTESLPSANRPRLNVGSEPGCGLAAHVAATRQPLRLLGEEVQLHPSWNRDLWTGLGWHFEPGSCHSFLAAPMCLPDGGLVGVLLARDGESRDGFSEFDEVLLKTLATNAAADFERVKSVVKAREEGIQAERKRLEADLHEAMNVLSIGVRWEAEILAEEMERDNLPAARIALRRLQAARTRAYTDLHYLLEDLRDPTLEREGLLASLRKRAELIGHGHITVLGDSWERLPPKVEGILYRVGQEAMDNAAKYSGAVGESGVKIEAWLERSDKQVRLCVRDNGIGFDVESTLALSHKWGLRRLCDTVHEMGGRLEIASAPGEGTMITATIDLVREGHEQ
jgi:PAS domain S-box-containing protein